jgi:hypothetical protein
MWESFNIYRVITELTVLLAYCEKVQSKFRDLEKPDNID